MSMVLPSNKLSPSEKANLFAASTRFNIHPLPSKSVAPGGSVSFDIPQVRLLSKIRLLVECVLTVTHAGATPTVPIDFAPWPLISQVRVQTNSNFNPYQVSGRSLYFYNLIRAFGTTVQAVVAGRGKTVMGLTSSAGGTPNIVRFLADIPLSLNDRDPVGLIMTQSKQAVVTLLIDTNTRALGLAADAAGYTFALSDITFTPFVETFSIPSVKEALPDISIVKLVTEQNQAVAGAGDQVVELPTGQTYRRLLFYITNAAGVGVTDASLTGEFQLVFNQADIPIRLRASVLAAINQEQYGFALPQGLYVLDFTYAGLANYGGIRDYIDTEKLTEFWIRWTAAVAGNISIVAEKLARLE